MKLNIYIQKKDYAIFTQVPAHHQTSALTCQDLINSALQNMQSWGLIDHYQVSLEGGETDGI